MMCKWIGGFIYQEVSGEFLFVATCSGKENRPEKSPFIAIKIVLAVRILHYFGKVVEKRRREAITKRYAFQANAKNRLLILVHVRLLHVRNTKIVRLKY